MLKDAVASNLKRDKIGADYIHFPEWLKPWFYSEIVAETRTEKGWENVGQARNESFDLLCYAKAGYLIKMDSYWKKELRWDNPPAWADEWDNNSEVSDLDNSDNSIKKTVTTRSRVRLKMAGR